MTQTDTFLTVNQWSRPGSKLKAVQALVIHWTANPGQGATGVKDYFESRKNGQLDYGSAHYVIGLKGEIIHMIPDDEVAYHCGTSKPDPASGKIYTDLARQKFGIYATDYKTQSPNSVTIGIEHCVTDWAGNMSTETIESSIELATNICRWHNLNPLTDILLHKDIVGWKDCHKWWINHPDAWQNYKTIIASKLD